MQRLLYLDGDAGGSRLLDGLQIRRGADVIHRVHQLGVVTAIIGPAGVGTLIGPSPTFSRSLQ